MEGNIIKAIEDKIIRDSNNRFVHEEDYYKLVRIGNFYDNNNYIDYKSNEGTPLAYDVPGTSPEGPLKVVTSRTYRGLSGGPQGTNTKTDNLMKKLFFRSNTSSITYVSCFLQKEQIFKSSKRGHPQDVNGTKLWDVPGTK